MRPAGLYRLGRRELRMTGVTLWSRAGVAGGHGDTVVTEDTVNKVDVVVA